LVEKEINTELVKCRLALEETGGRELTSSFVRRLVEDSMREKLGVILNGGVTSGKDLRLGPDSRKGVPGFRPCRREGEPKTSKRDPEKVIFGPHQGKKLPRNGQHEAKRPRKGPE
jgi:hypothetical protein